MNASTNDIIVPNVTSTGSELLTSGIKYDLRVFGKHEFIKGYPWTALPTIIILSLSSVVGTIGNAFVILAIAIYPKLRNKESMYFVSLAVSDIYVTIVADPMSIIGK